MQNEIRDADILAALEQLFESADKEGLWFYSNYQQIWMSPKELRERHENGKFIWGPQNWCLRDPKELIDSLNKIIESTNQQIARVEQRIQAK